MNTSRAGLNSPTANTDLTGGPGLNDPDRFLEMESRIKELETLMKNRTLDLRLAAVEARLDELLGPPCFVDPLTTVL